jgi:hypothetical protein
MILFLKKYSQIIVGIIFLTYFVPTLFNAVYLGNETFLSILLIPIIYFQSIYLFLYYYKKNNKPRLIDWLKVSLFIYLILDFIEIINISKSFFVKFSVTSISLIDSPFTILVIIFAFFALDIGYFINKKISRNKKENFVFNINYKNLIFILLIITTTIESYLLFAGYKGYASSIEHTSGIISLIKSIQIALNPLAIILSAYILFIEKNQQLNYKIIYNVSIYLQIFIGLLSGMKEEAIIPILYTLIVYLIGKNKIKKVYVYLFIFSLVILYPLNNSYRNIINNPFYDRLENTSKFYLALNQIINKPLEETFSTSSSSFGDRTSMYKYLQYSINIEPTWNYYNSMERYIYLPLVWIVPRTIWENKPRSDIGAELYFKLTGRVTNSITPTNIGWAYLEGGMLFVIIIFILLGIFFSKIDLLNLNNPFNLVLYAWCIHKVIKPEWDPYFLLAGAIQAFILYWIIIKLLGITKYTLKSDQNEK